MDWREGKRDRNRRIGRRKRRKVEREAEKGIRSLTYFWNRTNSQ